MRRRNEAKRAEQQREVSVGMKRLMTGYRTLLEASLETEGITLAQLRMLKALDEHADISAAELARICFITPQSMQAVVTRAERAGWIIRTASLSNRRVLAAALTPAGRQVLERGLAFAADIEQRIWGTTTAPELQAFNATLRKVLQRLQENLTARHAAASPARSKTA